MSNWDRLGKAQAALPGSNAPGGRGYYVPFGAAMDASSNLPDNPQTWNEDRKSTRLNSSHT